MKRTPSHLVFYKKHDCAPCLNANENLKYVLNLSPELDQHITVLQKEDHPDLVKANEITLYPTVLILDQNQKELARKVGYKFLTTHWFHAALTSIHLRSRA